jgi:hypothetical protein
MNPSESLLIPVTFDENLWDRSLSNSGQEAQRVAEHWHIKLSEGIPMAWTRNGFIKKSEAPHISQTDLPNCFKIYLPDPDKPNGPWVMVFQAQALTPPSFQFFFLAFGHRHPQKSPSVYQIAHGVLHPQK